jgi:hypothetical protein
MMAERRLLLTIFSIFALSWLASSQEIIENPDKPASKNAGRTIKLNEVLRIKDEGKEFFFKLPWGLDAADDGSIFVKDMDKLYKFSPNGKFVKNMVRIGQGPGEITREIENFTVIDNTLILACASMNKLVTVDLQGKFIKELIPKKKLSELIAYYNKKYFFVDFITRNLRKKEAFTELDRNLYVSDEEGNITSIPHSFPVKWYLYLEQDGRPSFIHVTELQTSRLCQKYVYVSHTQEYNIKQLDLEEARVSKCFKRVYFRVKFKPDKMRPFNHYNDVYRILIFKDKVWALTSTFDKSKGILVDVFNNEGKYLDNFFLPLFNSKTGDCFDQLYFPLTTKGVYLYAIEHDDDWNYCVVKYEIVDRSL